MADIIEVEPMETGTELARVMSEGNPETMLAILEKKAELAPRYNMAINTILASQTFPEDWTIQGDKACLSSAGAERVARLFGIRFYDHKCIRQDIRDNLGDGYRYVYECKAMMGDREVFAQGVYSTRDKFLGYANGDWKPTENVNEGHIRNAAYHICIGNAIKSLLGLRNIPVSRFREIMGGIQQDASKAATVSRGQGTQGGTSSDDAAKQAELAKLCIYIADAGMTVERNGKGWSAVQMADSDDRDSVERGKAICVAISGFTGKDGKEIQGLPASQLKGKRLDVTLGAARQLKAQIDGEADRA